jgi:L-ribulose-5-phosphate 3-epimerase
MAQWISHSERYQTAVPLSRRRFLAASAGALSTASRLPAAPLSNRICLFTDHLAGFELAEVARMLKQLGVAGPDLTVRKGGLVNPANAEQELPRAREIFHAAGLSIPMITTGILSAREPGTRPLLEAAVRAGIRFYKPGYFRYPDMTRWQETLEQTGRELEELGRLGRELGIQAGLHNHAGPNVGGAVWDGWQILQRVDPSIGFYFDPAQASIEGAENAWELNFRRVSGRLKMIAIKDYVWEKTGDRWKTKWVPLGQGMVRWERVLSVLQAAEWPGPISLHIEYKPGGNTKTERYDRSMEAAARDLAFLRKGLPAPA